MPITLTFFHTFLTKLPRTDAPIHRKSEKGSSRKLPACAATSSCSRYLLPLCAVLILLFEKLFLVLLLGTLLLLAALLPLGLLFLKCLNFLLLLF